MANLPRDRHNRRLKGRGDQLHAVVLKETKQTLEALARSKERALGAIIDELAPHAEKLLSAK